MLDLLQSGSGLYLPASSPEREPLSATVPLLRALLLLIALCSRATAAEPRLFVDLDYQVNAGEGCPSETAFQTLVTDQLGYNPFRPRSQLRVLAQAQAAEDGIRGSVQWYDSSGVERGGREMKSKSKDCVAFARAMSFAVAVQIQLLGQEAENSPTPASDPASHGEAPGQRPPAAAAAPPARQPPITEAPSDVSARWRFFIGAGPSVAFGLTPRTALEGRVFAGARQEWFALEIGAEASLPTRHVTDTPSGFKQQVALGSAAACMIASSVSGCLVTKMGRLSVRGFGVDVPRGPSGFVAQVGPRFALSSAFAGPWVGTLRVEMLATLTSWAVTLNQREVWETPILSVSVGADLAAILD